MWESRNEWEKSILIYAETYQNLQKLIFEEIKISLLCTTFKLTERLILKRINSVVEKFLPREQAGFRSGRSTVDQVASLTQNIEQAFDDKNVCGAIFLDLTAAYDTVWHLGLYLKLLKELAC